MLSSWILGVLEAADCTTSMGNQLLIFILKDTHEYLPLIFTFHYFVISGML